jgi:hypothetical protein
MANPKPNLPPEAGRWKPGQSGNPSGRPPLPPELRDIVALSGQEVRRVIARYARMNRAELQEAIQKPEIPVLDLYIASILAQGIKLGDFARLAFLLDRTVGRAPTEDPAEAEEDEARARLESMPENELIDVVREHLRNIEENGPTNQLR